VELQDATKVRQQLLECQMKHEDFDSRVDAVRHSASYRLLQRIGIFPAIDSAEPGATKD
jgi:hypothetical protein